MNKIKILFIQIIKFSGVGILCFVIDFGFLAFFKELFKLSSTLSAALSFTISVVVNYILSMRFVFVPNENRNKARNFIWFVLLSIIGLGINELIIWSGNEKLGYNLYFIKIVATAVVMVYNFITRKLILEK